MLRPKYPIQKVRISRESTNGPVTCTWEYKCLCERTHTYSETFRKVPRRPVTRRPDTCGVYIQIRDLMIEIERTARNGYQQKGDK